MASETYDIITVGGGLGGAALAKVMAEHGARVLVVEREKQFKDRVRGEAMLSWGVAETQALGLYDLLRTTCAHESARFGLYTEPEFGDPRDMVATTPQQLPVFTFSHPACRRCSCKPLPTLAQKSVAGQACGMSSWGACRLLWSNRKDGAKKSKHG